MTNLPTTRPMSASVADEMREKFMASARAIGTEDAEWFSFYAYAFNALKSDLLDTSNLPAAAVYAKVAEVRNFVREARDIVGKMEASNPKSEYCETRIAMIRGSSNFLAGAAERMEREAVFKERIKKGAEYAVWLGVFSLISAPFLFAFWWLL